MVSLAAGLLLFPDDPPTGCRERRARVSSHNIAKPASATTLPPAKSGGTGTCPDVIEGAVRQERQVATYLYLPNPLVEAE